MNYKLLGKILGKIMIMESALMLAPLLISLIYEESFRSTLAFAVPIFALSVIGACLQFPKPTRRSLYQKEGFALVALVWIVMTVFGAIPFVISGDVPNYIDACFEIMSGFSTTGASIIPDITVISHSILFWRSFSHWIGGMGILVFVLIFIPESSDGSSMHLLRAESPGPQVGKIASKMKVTARILYLIYAGLTIIEVIMLLCGPLVDSAALVADGYASYEGDKVFQALLTAFGSAGTGGFGFIPNSFQYFTPFAQYTVSIFLLLFGCNFALFYLVLLGKIKDVFKNEELRTYLLTILVAVGVIFATLLTKMAEVYTLEGAFRHSLFQVASIITTTGYSTTNFNMWPEVAKAVLVVLMFAGAMAGSTAGGIKLSRVIIAFKGTYVNIRKLINPRYVSKTKFEGKSLEEKTTNDVFSFIALYLFLLLIVTLVLSFDPISGTTQAQYITDLGAEAPTHGFASNFTAALSCMSNIGPGIEAVGPYASFAGYNWFSTLVLTFTMLIGRLEIFPVIILFTPRTWKRT